MTDFTQSESVDLILATLMELLLRLPIIAIAVVGIVLALRNRQKHPNTSRVALIAFGIMIATNVIFTSISVWLPVSVYRETNSVEAIGWLNFGMSIVGMITGSITWILLLLAIFKWRGPEEGVEQARELPRPYDVAATPYGAEPGRQG